MYGNQFFQNSEILNSLECMFEKDEIEALDMKRIYRFMDKNVKKEEEIDNESGSDGES